MIEYSHDTDYRPERFFAYFAQDGSYGNAEDIVIVDVTELDSHFNEFLEELKEWQIPDYMRWYVDNQTHDRRNGEYTSCEVCELWDSGMYEDDIIAELESREENA